MVKAKSLIKRIQQCIKSGIKLNLNNDINGEILADSSDKNGTKSDATVKPNKNLKTLVADLQAKRGDIGLYLVFYSIEGHYPKKRIIYLKGTHL